MTQINLLPWREQKREQEKKKFATMLSGCVIAAVLCVFLINYYASSLVSNQLARNHMLQNEMTQMNAQLKEIINLKKMREMFITRMSVVHHLQSMRTLMVHLFDELINIMPLGVYLTQVEGKQDAITVIGYTESNTYVSMLMKNIENNDWVYAPVLNEIKKEDTKHVADNGFKLTFFLAPQLQLGMIR